MESHLCPSLECLESDALGDALNQTGFLLIGLLGLVRMQLVVFFHKARDGLVTVGPHLHSKILVINFQKTIKIIIIIFYKKIKLEIVENDFT